MCLIMCDFSHCNEMEDCGLEQKYCCWNNLCHMLEMASILKYLYMFFLQVTFTICAALQGLYVWLGICFVEPVQCS